MHTVVFLKEEKKIYSNSVLCYRDFDKMKSELPLRTMDVITCGSCFEEFVLNDISEFIQHKAFECRAKGLKETGVLDKVLICSACRRHFRTSGALLQHVQDVHRLELYTEEFLYDNDMPKRNKGFCNYQNEYLSDRDNQDLLTRSCNRERNAGERRLCLRPTSEFEAIHSPGTIQDGSTSPEVVFHSEVPGIQGARNRVDRDMTLPREAKAQVLPLDLKISLREKVSVYREIPSDSDNCSSSSVDASCCSNRCILPKKRKWSIVEPCSDDCASPDTINSSLSPCGLQDTSIGEVSSSTPKSSNNFHNPTFLPKWRYSVDFRNSMPATTDLTDRRNNEQTCGLQLNVSAHHELPEDRRSPESCSSHSETDQVPEKDLNPKLTRSPDVLVQGSGSFIPQAVCATTQYTPTQNGSPENNFSADEVLSEALNSSESVNYSPGCEPQSDGLGKKRRYPTTRPFKCDFCEHSFNQRIHLKKHLSKHTGIKPFKCGLCDYSTVERSHLKVHIRIHTGEKPYKCTYCDYATAQNSTLKIHLKRHHGGRMFRCKTCGKCFTQFAMLGSHVITHNGE